MTTVTSTNAPRATLPALCALAESHLLNEQEAAQYLNVSPGTLSVWRSTGRYGLVYVKIGRRVKYRVSDLLAFVESRSRSHTGEGA
ncbi:helix-turn-helix domain-containing protein [Candidatus Methylospira mobilis]|uniref:Helix-turn-helix domain-containing protein n=1 Tax=Candidatus Methylospira mobilis TaxID=1808979 RepID=A0A5Q0BGY1_9GAMM|nr:helix-turn-helix domain-containing protein [Candidatus Methylospira mobilis]QFY43125.1 helix-turn-helix domain-containing protein [Candidatus Methylospira mobilis]